MGCRKSRDLGDVFFSPGQNWTLHNTTRLKWPKWTSFYRHPHSRTPRASNRQIPTRSCSSFLSSIVQSGFVGSKIRNEILKKTLCRHKEKKTHNCPTFLASGISKRTTTRHDVTRQGWKSSVGSSLWLWLFSFGFTRPCVRAAVYTYSTVKLNLFKKKYIP